jgi:hypothetical protein
VTTVDPSPEDPAVATLLLLPSLDCTVMDFPDPVVEPETLPFPAVTELDIDPDEPPLSLSRSMTLQPSLYVGLLEACAEELILDAVESARTAPKPTAIAKMDTRTRHIAVAPIKARPIRAVRMEGCHSGRSAVAILLVVHLLVAGIVPAMLAALTRGVIGLIKARACGRSAGAHR